MAAGPRHWHTKRGKITGGDEGSFAVNDRLQLLAYVLDDMVPGTGGLVLVVAGQAGHVASSYRGVADDHGRVAGGAYAGDVLEGGAELRRRVLGRERVRGRAHLPSGCFGPDGALDHGPQGTEGLAAGCHRD